MKILISVIVKLPHHSAAVSSTHTLPIFYDWFIFYYLPYCPWAYFLCFFLSVFHYPRDTPLPQHLLHWYPLNCSSAPGGLVLQCWFHPVKLHGPWWAPGGTGNRSRHQGVMQNDVYPSVLRNVCEHQGEGWHLLPYRGTLNKTGASYMKTQ